ncbi:MAG: hypothetical protein M1830_001618 [Pleopsidium flavum]|nr:MAG: hypothetical protein M1830_001618 [Pleopsidium flavum]
MSHKLEYPPAYYCQSQDGVDKPKIDQKPQTPRICRVLIWGRNGENSISGAFEGKGPMRVSYDLSSQMPLIILTIEQGPWKVDLSYDNTLFSIFGVHENDAVEKSVRKAKDAMHLDVRQREQRQLTMVHIQAKTDQGVPSPVSPVVKHNHPSRLTGAQRQLFEALIGAKGVSIFRVQHHGVVELFRFYRGIQQAREELTGEGIPATDYWHYTREKGYSDVPGERLKALDKGVTLDPTPPYWMATELNYTPSEQNRKVPVVWGKYPPKSSFHNMHEYEMIMGAAARHEREQVKHDLLNLFESKTPHRSRFNNVVDSNTNSLAWIHVDINTEDEGRKVIPPSGTRVRVSFWQEGVEAREKDDWRGLTMDVSTTADFAILAEAPSAGRWSEGVKRVTLKADIDSTSMNRMIQRMQDAVTFEPEPLPEDDECGRFDLHATLLAHGPSFDKDHCKFVNLFKLVSPNERDEGARRYGRVLDMFKLDHFQLMAFNASTMQLVAGLAVIQGAPGTGKTRVNACIAIALASVGIKVLVTAASNNGAEALLGKIVDALEENEQLKEWLDIVHFQTPNTTADIAVSQDPTAPKPGRLEATAALRVGLHGKSDDEQDPRLVKYSMAAKVFRYAEQNRGSDADCKEWWRLRNNIAVKSRNAKDKDYGEFLDVNEKLSKVVLRRPKMTIVASTLNNTSHKVLRENGYEPKLLMVDEAGQSLELDNVIAMTLPSLRAVVLTGDQKQLSPTVLSALGPRNPYAKQLATSLFARLIVQSFPFCMLQINYRMHPDISLLPNTLFYDGRLTNADNTTVVDPISRTFIEFCRSPQMAFGVFNKLGALGVRRMFVNVPFGRGEHHPGSTSVHNPANVNVVRKLVWDLLRFQPSEQSVSPVLDASHIGIITPYKDEKREIVRELANDSLRLGAPSNLTLVKVATVDGFQGREAEIIILDLTAANPRDPARIGFVGDAKRLNVGLTRPKSGLIIIGNMDLWWKAITFIIRPENRPDFGRFMQDVHTRSHLVEWPNIQNDLGLYVQTSASLSNPPPGDGQGGSGSNESPASFWDDIATGTSTAQSLAQPGSKRKVDDVMEVEEGPAAGQRRHVTPQVQEEEINSPTT